MPLMVPAPKLLGPRLLLCKVGHFNHTQHEGTRRVSPHTQGSLSKTNAFKQANSSKSPTRICKASGSSDLHARTFTFNCPDRSGRRSGQLCRVPEGGAEVTSSPPTPTSRTRSVHRNLAGRGQAKFALVGDPTHALTNAFGVHIPEKCLARAAPSSSTRKASSDDGSARQRHRA